LRLHQLSRKVAVIVVIFVIAIVLVAGHFTDSISMGTPASSTTTSMSWMYLLSIVGSCRGPGGYVPCFGGNYDQAEVFNCATPAASSAGCVQLVADETSPQFSYQITVWYPYSAHSNEPSWANCRYKTSGDPGQQYYARCVSTNSTAFIVSQPTLPPV